MKKITLFIVFMLLSISTLFSFNLVRIKAAENLIDPEFGSVTAKYDSFGDLSGFSSTITLPNGTYVFKSIGMIGNEPDPAAFKTRSVSPAFTYLNYGNWYSHLESAITFVHRVASGNTEFIFNAIDEYGVSVLKTETTLQDLLESFEVFEITSSLSTSSPYYLTNNNYTNIKNFVLEADLASYETKEALFSSKTLGPIRPLDVFNNYYPDGNTHPFTLISGPSLIESAQSGTKWLFKPSWIPKNSAYTLSLEVLTGDMMFNFRAGDIVFNNASTDTSYNINLDPIIDNDFVPSEYFKLAPMSPLLPSSVSQTYTFIDFVPSDASYRYIPGEYTAIVKFVGDIDTLEYVINLNITTEFSKSFNIGAKRIIDDEEIVYSNGALIDLGSFYDTDTTELALINSSIEEYFSFYILAYPNVTPESSFKILNSKNQEFSNDTLLWYQVPDKYKILYTATYVGAPNFTIALSVNINENKPPVIIGTSVYNQPNNETFDLSEFLSSYYIKDDRDSTTAVLEILSSDIDFNQPISNYEPGKYNVVLRATDEDGLKSERTIAFTIYEPLIPNDLFKMLFSISSSLIVVLLGVYSFRTIKSKARRRS